MEQALVSINREDARILLIEDGDLVEVRSPLGAITAEARISTNIIRGHVFVPFHYNDALVNRLTDSAVDPLGKTPCFKVIPIVLQLATSKLAKLEQIPIEEDTYSIREARLFSVYIYESMIKQGYIPITSGTYFGKKSIKWLSDLMRNTN
ncbi:MAG: hypothetical protein JSW11_21935 [Candidatus Heimdallarchaeota archaeon]|nr:MAG: hypothetical protein JSW11_21935 [Candidatus Heimdallarchaeota archaeon]